MDTADQPRAGSTAETMDGDSQGDRASRDAGDPIQLEVGAAVGRYVIEGVLGIGGMGVVYAARDPGLDRGVAVKVLRPKAGRSAEIGHRRLVREAQALAKLSHVNVVTVFDVGVHEASVFVAMERLRGKTLTAWANPRRTASEILHAFGQAGLGLAAAHEVGLVHRDFKPDNVFVCAAPPGTHEIGRVCVTDFGLARVSVAEKSAELESSGALPTAEQPLMQTDGIAGTPAYMAPEQISGLDTGAAADQFAFCVALYEALFHQRPFAGETATRVAVEVLEGRVRIPPRVRGVSRAVTRAILRGLAADPDARWPSMRELLAAIAPRQRRWVWAIAGAAIAVAGGVAIMRMPSRAAVCDTATAAVDEAWHPARARALADAFVAAGPSGAASFDAIHGSIDAHAAKLRAATTRACVEHREQPTFDAERACLAARTTAFDRLLAVLEHADAKIIDRAPFAIGNLVDPDECADPRVLALELAPPPESAVAIEALRERVAAATASFDAGRYDDVITLGRPLLAEARALGWDPLIADVAWELGRALGMGTDPKEGEQLVAEAYWTAAAAGYDRIAARAAIELIYAIGHRGGRLAEAATWEQHAIAAVTRLGLRSAEDATLQLNRSVVEQARGNFDRAYELATEAHAIRRDVYGEHHVATAAAEQNMGAIRLKQGRLDDARLHLERARVDMIAALGPGHPTIGRIEMNIGALALKSGDLDGAEASIARAIAAFESRDAPGDLYQALNNMALVQRRRGDLAAASATLDRALVAVERAHGKQHTGYATVLTTLGTVASARGEHERALALSEEALAIREALLGPDHEELAYALGGIGGELVFLGRPERARLIFERQLALLVRALGADHARTALSHLNLAKVLLALGEHEAGTTHVERAVDIYRAVLPPDHPETAAARSELSRARLVAGRIDDAVAEATLAEAMLQRMPGEPPALGVARFNLAKALWKRDAANDRTRADALVAAARTEFSAVADAPRLHAEIAAWQAARE